MLLASLRHLVSKCKYSARRSETRRYVYIMNIVRYPTDRLVNLLHEQKVATLPQLKAALGTSVTLTVLRKLAPLDYRAAATPIAGPTTRWIPSLSTTRWDCGRTAISIFRDGVRCSIPQRSW